jgi:membrane protease YdiL (CAAX protease family)
MKAAFRLIQPPPRSTRAGISIVFASACILSVVSFLDTAPPWIVIVSLFLVALSVLARELQALHLALFTVLLVASSLRPSLHTWPLFLLIPLLGYFAVALSVPKLRTTILWMHGGRLRRDIMLIVLAVAVVSGIALFVWYRAIRPDLAIQLGHMPAMPLWMFPLAGLGFSLGNAALEELAYRGIIMQALDSAGGPGLLSVIVQAWLFGAAHYRAGFPNGTWGLAMATVYGIMLGGLRHRSRGMLAPWLAHVLADGVVFTILVSIVLRRAG